MDLAFIGWLLFDERHDVGSHDVKLSHNRSTAIFCNARTRLVGVSSVGATRVVLGSGNSIGERGLSASSAKHESQHTGLMFASIG